MQQTTWVRGVAACSIALAATLAAGGVWAQGAVISAHGVDVRGGATIISHGWGVYTGYWHQSRIDVKVGDTVQTGQTIGYCGDSGRATGPHLHFDLLVGGVEVDPEDWLYG